MSSHRSRLASPPPKVYLETPRTSTGAVLPNPYDTRFGQPRASFSSVSSARDNVSAARNSVYETQPVRKSTYVDPVNSGGTISRTEYAIRPRHGSQSNETRRPLNVMPKNISPSRDYPSVSEAPREVTTSKAPPRDDSANRFLQPARASHQNHHRHNSATRAELDRYNIGSNRESRQKDYHRSGPYVEKVYPSSRPAARGAEDDWSYTGPREQFARDYPSRPARRNSLTRRERPQSAIDPDFKQLPWKRDTGPPPAAARQLERIEQPRSGFESDPERNVELPRRRHSTRAPILHQQRDEEYPSSRDDYARRPSKMRDSIYDGEVAVGKSRQKDLNKDVEYDRERDRDRDKIYKKEYERERERPNEKDRYRDRAADRDRERERDRDRDRHVERDRDRDRERPRDYESYDRDSEARRTPRSRETSPDHHSGLKGLAAATGIGGIAAAALASRKGRKEDEDSGSESRRDKKHRRHRSRDNREDSVDPNVENDDHVSRGQHDRHRKHGNESSGSDTPEDQASRSHKHRSSKRRHRRDEEEVDSEPSRAPIPVVEQEDREQENNEPGAENFSETQRRGNDSPTDLEGRTLSPGEGDDDRPRRVQLVEPVKDKLDGPKPRGILKAPRMVPFPEDPNPTREGVAPLKAAGKDGIPATARWTKINRMLVNPEALERSHERFEERDDYVVVLRVLTREEIEKFAERTKEIRETRERAWQQQLDDRRRRKAEQPIQEEPHDLENGTQEEPPLAIEPPPNAPPVDLRNLQGQNAENTERILAGNMPVPDITVESSNYSENV